MSSTTTTTSSPVPKVYPIPSYPTPKCIKLNKCLKWSILESKNRWLDQMRIFVHKMLHKLCKSLKKMAWFGKFTCPSKNFTPSCNYFYTYCVPPHIWKFSKKSRKFVNQDVPKLPRCEEDANEGCHLTFLSTPSIGNNLVQLTRIIEGDASQNNQKTYFSFKVFCQF